MEERVAGEERGKLGSPPPTVQIQRRRTRQQYRMKRKAGESTADGANTAEKDKTAEATGSNGGEGRRGGEREAGGVYRRQCKYSGEGRDSRSNGEQGSMRRRDRERFGNLI
jgi:hypothetical protein